MVDRPKAVRQRTARAKRWRAPVADVPMRPLRAPRATIVPVSALVDGKMAVGSKTGVDPKVDADRKTGVAPKMDVALKMGAVPKVVAARKTGVVLKADADQKADAAPKAVAVLKTGAVPMVDAVPDDVRSHEWSSLSVR